VTELESTIHQRLLDLDRAVRSMPTANPKPNLLPLFTQLDELAAQIPRDGDLELKHFLHRKSYEKARLHLEGRRVEVPRGVCGH